MSLWPRSIITLHHVSFSCPRKYIYVCLHHHLQHPNNALLCLCLGGPLSNCFISLRVHDTPTCFYVLRPMLHNLPQTSSLNLSLFCPRGRFVPEGAIRPAHFFSLLHTFITEVRGPYLKHRLSPETGRARIPIGSILLMPPPLPHNMRKHGDQRSRSHRRQTLCLACSMRPHGDEAAVSLPPSSSPHRCTRLTVSRPACVSARNCHPLCISPGFFFS
uniref:Squidulin n=1 Tax=Schistocephalus solidus TaxID=70667 RepID=A0A0V0JCB8_SCHSO